MAHVKMIRRSMLPDEWTDVRIRWLKRMIIAAQQPIEGWTVREGRQIDDTHYEMYDAQARPLHPGDLYFTPDGTAFLHAEAVLDGKMAGCSEVRLRLSTAAEMLVRVNGVLCGGIDPNRETMVLPKCGDGRYVFDIEGYNRSKPDDDRNEDASRLKGCRQVFQGASFVVLNQEAEALYYDVAVFRDIVKGGQFDEDYCAMVSDSLYHALSLVDYESGAGLGEARAYIRRELYASRLYRGAGSVALIAHSHLDIAYYWQRKHAIQKNARTCLIQLELMERYPFLKYTHTQAYLFETLQRYFPKLFERLREKVKTGRFEPVGGMYVESDCNVPAAESLTRQFLYGQRYFRDMFGKACTNCWLPDVFGNSAVLPQILKKSGVSYFVSNKMSTWNDTNRFPHNSFIWRGIDGSTVYACVPPTHFITAATPTEIMQNWAAYQDKDSGAQTLCMYGYGDGGSGVTEDMLHTIERLGDISAMPEVTMPGAQEFLESNFNPEKKLAEWDGELYLEMHRGTFTTKAELKKQNRRLEYLLRDVELACTLRWLQGADYPAEELRGLWKKLLINQFHDILPGSHIHPVYEDAMADYRTIEAGCQRLLAGDEQALFNTLSFDRAHAAFVPCADGADSHCGERGRYVHGDMPALASATLRDEKTDPSWIRLETEDAGGLRISTGVLNVTMLSNGAFTSVTDANGREYVDGAFNELRLFRDIPGNYDAWDILPTYREVQLPVTLKKAAQVEYLDGYTCVVRCEAGTDRSTFVRRIRFFRDEKYVECEYHVDWHEDHVLAKAEFECNVRAPYALCDIGAGFLTRELNRNTTWQQARYEVCQHKWCDMSETGGGVAIINNGKYGVGLQKNRISLSLLRSTCRPDLISDRGEHDFGYLMLFHEGSAVDAGVNKLALEYNVPLRTAALPALRLPALKSLYLQSVKQSEDGRHVILRLTEQDGCRGVLRMPFAVSVMNLLEDEETTSDAIAYQPFEMLTLGLPLQQTRQLLGEG